MGRFSGILTFSSSRQPRPYHVFVDKAALGISLVQRGSTGADYEHQSVTFDGSSKSVGVKTPRCSGK